MTTTISIETIRKIGMSRERLLDLFILCLSWQWDQSAATHMWTTFDKVRRILGGLNVQNDAQWNSVLNAAATHSYVKSKTKLMTYMDAASQGDRKESLLNANSLLVCYYPPTKGFDPRRLMRDYRIFLTRRGKMYSERVEADYASFLSREIYWEEIERQEALLSLEAIAPVMENYRRKIEIQFG